MCCRASYRTSAQVWRCWSALNLAFGGGAFHRVEESERERIVARMGELLNRWPAAIKKSKEPPWSQTSPELVGDRQGAGG